MTTTPKDTQSTAELIAEWMRRRANSNMPGAMIRAGDALASRLSTEGAKAAGGIEGEWVSVQREPNDYMIGRVSVYMDLVGDMSTAEVWRQMWDVAKERQALAAAPPSVGGRLPGRRSRELVGKHLGPHLAISPTPCHEAIVNGFTTALLALLQDARQ